MDAKRKKSGFTLAELLTVLGIIALLVGLLLPALGWVRRVARETKQKAQLTTIGLALEAFKNDDGDYPPSDGYEYQAGIELNYCGAQKLAEALLGWDLMGFHPNSAWRADGYDGGLSPEGWLTYDPEHNRDFDVDGVLDTLHERVGPYLELATTNAFRLGNNPLRQDPYGLFNDTLWLASDTYVICDVFGIPERRITLANGKTVTPGTPILYYRADTSSKRLKEIPDFAGNAIYDFRDNSYLIGLGKIGDASTIHPWAELDGKEAFYEYIRDPKITATPWPYRPDSYILISAGADGEYGTGDDITNFGN